MSNDDAHILDFTPEALEVIKNQLRALAAIECFYGKNSSQYLRMLETWSQCMASIIRLGGHIRSDGKIDLLISQATLQGDHELSQQIVQYLTDQGGTSTLTDKSDPEEIYRVFKVSKKKYKQALGNLYKSRKITITPGMVQLVE